MGNQGWSQDSTGYPPSHTRWEFPLYACRNSLSVIACMRVNTKTRSRELGVAYIGIKPYL